MSDKKPLPHKVPALRMCLGGCETLFISSGPWNRVCPRCTRLKLDRKPVGAPSAKIGRRGRGIKPTE